MLYLQAVVILNYGFNRRLSMKNYLVIAIILLSTVAFGQLTADPRYHTVDEVIDEVLALADTFSTYCYVETLAFSPWFDKPILAMRISENPTIDEDETTLEFHGGQHADEPAGVEACMWMIKDLLHRIDDGDSAATLWWQTYEIWIIPQMNTDGRIMCLDSGYVEWRKTCADLDSNGVLDAYTDGVDPNRNWDYEWESYTPEDLDNTKGYEPWSETCVVAMRDFFERERPLIEVDMHSPDYTGGNKLWTCWFFEDGPWDHTYTPEGSNSFDEIRYYLSTRIKDEEGDSYEGLWANQNKPKLQNWVYYNLGSCAILYEITNQCFWHADTIDTIAARVGRGCYYLMERPLERLLVVHVVDTFGLPVTDAEVEILELQHDYIPARTVDPVFGTSRRLLRGNMYYTLQIAAPGMPTEIHDSIYIANGSAPVIRTIIIGDDGIEETARPHDFTLSAYPNPFNSAVTISVGEGLRPSRVEIFDINGRMVEEIIPPSPPFTRGEEEGKSPLSEGGVLGGLVWQPDEATTSGIYLVRAKIGDGQTATKRIVYLK